MSNSEVSTSIEATVAGFIVWLARQSPPPDQRQYCPTHVERFLRWRYEQQTQGASHDAGSYYARMGRSGEQEARIAEARTAITLLRRYLLSTD